MSAPAKPCKYCGSLFHWPFQCRQNPSNRRQKKPKPKKPPSRFKIRVEGYNPRWKPSVEDPEWRAAREAWFRAHPAEFYFCYICDRWLPRNETTLDHVRPRGSHVKLKYDLSNLEPCCGPCNYTKGSKSLQAYIAERDAKDERVSAYARGLACD